jgi:oxygen-independent coproporphyrinogen-3 oxidase
MQKKPLIIKFCVPFCVKKCEYCSRAIVEGWDSGRLKDYLGALQKEVRANANQFGDYQVQALHWGAGLASMASAQDVSDTMALLHETYDVAKGAPVTMRAAISNISAASMPFFKRAGITRFDFEMMSLSPVGYHALNKRDSLSDFPVVCDYFLRSYANDTLGLVLVFGSEQAGLDNLRLSIVEFCRSNASHLVLQRFEGSSALSAAEVEEQLEEARKLLSAAGFVEYVPLHFARPGKEDTFTTQKAAGTDLLSFGLGGTTFLEGVASRNTNDLACYLAYSDDFSRITTEVQVL